MKARSTADKADKVACQHVHGRALSAASNQANITARPTFPPRRVESQLTLVQKVYQKPIPLWNVQNGNKLLPNRSEKTEEHEVATKTSCAIIATCKGSIETVTGSSKLCFI